MRWGWEQRKEKGNGIAGEKTEKRRRSKEQRGRKKGRGMIGKKSKVKYNV